MKQCPECKACFEGESWLCPHCGQEPMMRDGFPVFAPDLASGSEGYPVNGHRDLARTESTSFWFQGRSALLQYVLERYFPEAVNILEIGCGTGFVLAAFARSKPERRVTGAEMYTEALKYARANVPDARLIQMDARSIPFVDEFDVVGLFDVLEHVDDDTRVIREAHKCLKSGGGMIITVPQHPWLWSPHDEAACHHRRYAWPDLKEKVEQAGFTIRRHTSFVSLLLPLMFLSRLRLRLKSENPHREQVLQEMQFSRTTNAILGAVLNMEIGFLKRGLSFPAGGSLLCVAKKTEAKNPFVHI